jgi:hypothetical protein
VGYGVGGTTLRESLTCDLTESGDRLEIAEEEREAFISIDERLRCVRDFRYANNNNNGNGFAISFL